MSTVTLGGSPVEVAGQFPAVGAAAAEFSLVDKGLADITLASLGATRKVLNIVPSLDTGTCAASARKFNEVAGSLDNTQVLIISADLPFAASRFCEAEGLANVRSLSLLRGGDAFKTAYGVDVVSGPLAGLTARAVIVLDADNRVLHSQLVAEIKDEPNYEAALAVLK